MGGDKSQLFYHRLCVDYVKMLSLTSSNLTFIQERFMFWCMFYFEFQMKAYVETYEEFFYENMPNLQRYFITHKLTPDLYLYDW